MVVLFLCSSIGFGQLPNWLGTGGSYSGASPHWGGWGAIALPISQGQQIYSYSGYEATAHRHTVPTVSTTTGLATVLRSFTRDKTGLYILMLATAGEATSSSATTASFSGGGMALFRFKSGFTLELIVTADKSASPTVPNFKLGSGWAW